MPSPFPGMDPYLESWIWPDFHGSMLGEIRTALNAVLPRRYAALIDRYVWLEEADDATRVRLGVPDVTVAHRGDVVTGTTALEALPAPASVTLPVERREGTRYIRVYDLHSRRVVTVLELLSPANKTSGGDREKYLAKRNEYLATGTNLVEVDLLRAGERLPLGEPAPVPADYYVLVSRGADFPKAGIWPFSVRDLIPPLIVPLSSEDAPVVLELKPLTDRVYDIGRYADELDYGRPPRPPLREPDATWARELLARHLNPPPSAPGDQP
jgi:hypothetical protein